MAKFAINYVLMPVYEVDYVVEAADEDEARMKAEELLHTEDGEFVYMLAEAMSCSHEGDYEIGEVLEIDDDAPVRVGEFFYEPVG